MLRTDTEQNWNMSEISDCVTVVVLGAATRATRTDRRPGSMHARSFMTSDSWQNLFECKREDEEEDHCFLFIIECLGRIPS